MSPLKATFCPSLQPYFFMSCRPTRRPERSPTQSASLPSTTVASSKTFRSRSASDVEKRANWFFADWSMYDPPNHCIRIASTTPGRFRIFGS